MNKKLIKKNQIIENSIDIMYLKGYNGTSVKDITDAAGIPKGSFYNYFEDKEHYAVDALYHFFYEMTKENFEFLKDKNFKPLDRIKNFYKNLINQNEEAGFKLGCFVGNITQEMGDISTIISEATDVIHKEIVKRIHACLIEACELNELNPKVDTEKLSNFIVSSWQGTLLRMKASKNRQDLDDFYEVLAEVLLK
ncbi:TetR/AcrR family transcriptional regulator [Clostridium ganghwense]|uniref:TetR family transcriptional regulator C-terminal domain-containing protein n=1 Tax=Clostridium ganghwense TaxID=312089 RepID=A0ABT4CNH7_9CLOT|nr:TetR/AcrR family transcriptional regulator [Clostridium ganghwense]MCY6370587.1 TetR family transcriptional regulator C-terminal domain-containing protein [Clostridium ganghwense]